MTWPLNKSGKETQKVKIEMLTGVAQDVGSSKSQRPSSTLVIGASIAREVLEDKMPEMRCRGDRRWASAQRMD